MAWHRWPALTPRLRSLGTDRDARSGRLRFPVRERFRHVELLPDDVARGWAAFELEHNTAVFGAQHRSQDRAAYAHGEDQRTFDGRVHRKTADAGHHPQPPFGEF